MQNLIKNYKKHYNVNLCSNYAIFTIKFCLFIFLGLGFIRFCKEQLETTDGPTHQIVTIQWEFQTLWKSWDFVQCLCTL